VVRLIALVILLIFKTEYFSLVAEILFFMHISSTLVIFYHYSHFYSFSIPYLLSSSSYRPEMK
jgi:hypothetical protein